MDENTPLDALDLQLLRLLQADASGSIQALAEATGSSATTCHRRIKRLEDEGYIERRVALLSLDRLKQARAVGLQALVEVTLDPQTQDNLARFEAAAVADAAVQQCWRTSPGPDFFLVLALDDMDDYHAVGQRLFTATLNVRNVRTFFATRRAKCLPGVPLLGGGGVTDR